MLDIGWTELLVVALVLLIVVGPKDLPRVLRTVGRWTAKARSLAREFQVSIDDMARETDLADMKRELNSISSTGIAKNIEDQINPTGSLARASAETVGKTPAATDEEQATPAAEEQVTPAADAKREIDSPVGADAETREPADAATTAPVPPEAANQEPSRKTADA